MIAERKFAYAAAKGRERFDNRRAKQLKNTTEFNELIKTHPKAEHFLQVRFDDYIQKYGSVEENIAKAKRAFQEQKKHQYKI